MSCSVYDDKNYKLVMVFCTCEQEKPPEVGEEVTDHFYDAEILDEMTTSRGELKLRTSFSSEDRFSQVS
jgi:hypothetical protein